MVRKPALLKTHGIEIKTTLLGMLVPPLTDWDFSHSLFFFPWTLLFSMLMGILALTNKKCLVWHDYVPDRKLNSGGHQCAGELNPPPAHIYN